MTVTLSVNGHDISVPEGATVLDAINASETYISQLCKDPDMKPIGACRTCLVQIDGVRGFPASCSVPAADGMAVNTESPEVRRIRSGILELTMAMLPSSNDHRDDGAESPNHASPQPVTTPQTVTTHQTVITPQTVTTHQPVIPAQAGIHNYGIDYGQLSVAAKHHGIDSSRWQPRLREEDRREQPGLHHRHGVLHPLRSLRPSLPGRAPVSSAQSTSWGPAAPAASAPSWTSPWLSRSAPPAASACPFAPPAPSGPNRWTAASGRRPTTRHSRAGGNPLTTSH